jgi:serine/threonine protein kinase
VRENAVLVAYNDPVLGETIGSYAIEAELGRGGMGTVYLGVHALLGRKAAVKILLPELSQKQDIVQRFFNEARAATAIRHSGIVEVYDFGFSDDGCAYIVMEYLDGESLQARLHGLGRLTQLRTLGIARQMVSALAAAHKAGIVHRDLKPDNVFLVPDDDSPIGERVKLLDFGIAKLAADSGIAPGIGEMARTSTGAIMGTPYYMSPEQCRGAGRVDARSDLYAFGCVLYEMLCGEMPFTGDGAGEVLAAHIHLPPPALRARVPDLSPGIEALVTQLLAKDPDRRPQSADEVGHALDELLADAGMATSPRAGTIPPVRTSRSYSVQAPSFAGVLETLPQVPSTIDSSSGEVATPARRTRLYVGAGAAVIAAAAVGIVVLGGGGDRSKDRPGVGEVAAVALGDVAGEPDGELELDPESMSSDRILLLEAARQALAEGRWSHAGELARAIVSIDPDDQMAQQIAAVASVEAPASAAARTILGLTHPDDYPRAIDAFARIAPTSRYHAEVEPVVDKLRAGYVKSAQRKVRALVKKHACAEARAIADQVAELAPDDARAFSRELGRCKDRVVEDDAAPLMLPAELDPKAEVARLINEGITLVDSNPTAALDRFDDALIIDRKNRKARLGAATAACALGHHDRVRGYLDGITGAAAEALLARCVGAGE